MLGVPVMGAAAYALLQTGSRGPLLATVAAVVVTVLLARDKPTLSRTAVLLVVAMVHVVVDGAAEDGVAVVEEEW